MKISTSIRINASADVAWAVIGPGFGQIDQWASAVTESTGTGGARPDGAPEIGRACTIADPGVDQLTEQLIEYDPEGRRLTYLAVSGMPSFVERALSTWSVAETEDGGSIFSMDYDIQIRRGARALAPIAAMQLRRFAQRTSRDLAEYLETGEVSVAKQVQQSRREASRLDRILLANAVFSGLSGAALAAIPSWWSDQLGNTPPSIISGIGLGLLAFAAVVANIAGRGTTPLSARTISTLDAGWVVGSAALLLTAGPNFTPVGLIAVSGAAIAVGALAASQLRALRESNYRSKKYSLTSHSVTSRVVGSSTAAV